MKVRVREIWTFLFVEKTSSKIGDLLQNVRFRDALLETGCRRCSKNHPRCFVRRENGHGRRCDFAKNEYKCAFCVKNYVSAPDAKEPFLV